MHLPHSKSKNLKIIHRLVVLPDFQGLGIGSRFCEIIGNEYINNGFRFLITTTNPALIHSFKKNKIWKCTKFGRFGKHQGCMRGRGGILKGSTLSESRLKVSFELSLQKK